MNTIKNPSYGKFRAPEYLQLMTTVLDIYKKNQSQVTLLNEKIVTFEQAVKSMMRVLNDSKGVTIISELTPLDKMRIKAVRGLKLFLQADVFRDRPERVRHAKILLQSFKQHCNEISRASFEHKTISINKMLEEWQTGPAYIEAVKILNAESWVQDVSERNEVFYRLYLEKAESSERDIKTNELRANLRAVFEDLSTDTFALARVAPDKEVYQSLVKSLNNVINLNNDTVLRRRPKRRRGNPPMPSLPVPV